MEWEVLSVIEVSRDYEIYIKFRISIDQKAE